MSSSSVFTRQGLREILGDDIDKSKLDAIFNLYQSSIDGTYVSRTDSNRAIEDAVNKYKADNPQKKYDEYEEYRNLKNNYDSLILDNKLKDVKVKLKYVGLVKSKLDQADIETSLKKVKEEYPEFFEDDNTNPPADTPNPKPQISTEVQNKTDHPDATQELYNQFVKGLK